jgi:hypothetical protein
MVNIFFIFRRFFNQILRSILYIHDVSRIVLEETGLAWPVGDRPMRDLLIAHLKSCEPRTLRWSKVYWIIVHVLDRFKNHHNLLINGLLTAKAGWGVYCFVVVRGGGDAGSGLRHGGPEPQARRLPIFQIFQKSFPHLLAESPQRRFNLLSRASSCSSKF